MGLTKGQVLRLVNDYIGVIDGYLGQPLKFTYRTHREFYPIYCELNSIDPDSMEGITRERFITILLSAKPTDQAKIIRGIFKKFPPDCIISHQDAISCNGVSTDLGLEFAKRIAIQGEYLKIAEELERNSLSAISNIIDSETALKALRDAEILLKERGAQSSIDRVHTIFHAFLISICKKNQFVFNDDNSITGLFKIIKERHPAFSQDSQNEIGKIIRSLGNVIDALNPIRNHRSLAHPNDNLLPEEDAQFVIDVAVVCIQYIGRKVK